MVSRRILRQSLLVLSMLCWQAPLQALQTPEQDAEIEQSLGVVSATNRSAAASQEEIDRLSRETQALLEEYRKLRDGSAYQAAYTQELEARDQAQRAQIDDLRSQIERARITRQRIVPLMRSMADALEKFVVLDLPFHHEERIGAVLQLKQRLAHPDLSVSSKFRLLLEAYQLEREYGGRIEAWRGPLQAGGEERSVEYLRVGRVALYYQSLDGEQSAYWDRGAQDWVPLDTRYHREISRAMQVARELSAPELLELPMPVPGESP
jgi:cell division protein FtsB